MTDLIRRADVLAYPIRIDHYDKEHGNRHFVLGIESVLEYVESLPSVELVLQTPQTYGKSINPSNAEVVSDYIRRADAIEAICMNDCGGCRPNECGAYLDKSCDVVKALSALPSADITETETCQKCQETTERILNNQGERIKALEASADAVQGWRTDKPTENGEYMVTLDAWGHRYIDVMHYAKPLMPNREVDGICWYRDDDEWGDVVYDDADVIAWMPLPTPYKGGDTE